MTIERQPPQSRYPGFKLLPYQTRVFGYKLEIMPLHSIRGELNLNEAVLASGVRL